MSHELEQIQFTVSGLVQGVGFRYAAVRVASSLGVTGWVRNTHDDRVEVLAEGKPEALNKLLTWCHRGPALARVHEVQVTRRSSLSEKQYQTFDIQR